MFLDRYSGTMRLLYDCSQASSRYFHVVCVLSFCYPYTIYIMKTLHELYNAHCIRPQRTQTGWAGRAGVRQATWHHVVLVAPGVNVHPAVQQRDLG